MFSKTLKQTEPGKSLHLNPIWGIIEKQQKLVLLLHELKNSNSLCQITPVLLQNEQIRWKKKKKIPCKSCYFTGYTDTELTSRERLSFLWTTLGHAGSASGFQISGGCPAVGILPKQYLLSAVQRCSSWWEGGNYQIEPVFVFSTIVAGPLLPVSQRKLRY